MEHIRMGCSLSAPGKHSRHAAPLGLHTLARNCGGTGFPMQHGVRMRSAFLPPHTSGAHLAYELLVTRQTPAMPQAMVSGYTSPNWHARVPVAPSQMKAVQTAAVGRMRTGLGGKGGKKSLGGSTAPQGPR